MAEVLDVAAAAVSEGMLAENAGAYVVKHQEGTASQGSGFMLRFIQVKPEDVVDVFVYVAVLNLAIEYLPAVIERELHAFATDRGPAQALPRTGPHRQGQGHDTVSAAR